ncbi:MAG TPA: DEAD/DEAH box helicase, partial [Verrucomicrobiota bacterium]|nr:DEAD/DEAH box helicase [Verrucomicrobiota bacterium]
LGRIIEMEPHLDKSKSELFFTHEVILPGKKTCALSEVRFFAGEPALALICNEVFLLRNPPPQEVLGNWAKMQKAPVSKLTHRLLTKLRKITTTNGVNWSQLCKTHKAKPRFVFEMANDTVRLKLLAKSESDKSLWQWNGHEWIHEQSGSQKANKPEVLDDDRLEAAVAWLQRLDWFTPEPGLWVGDANPHFLESLHTAWPDKPDAEYLGDEEFKRLFLQPKRLKPKLIVRGSGIDWLSVSAEWEEEGMKLTDRDLQQLAGASGNFVNLPDAGWVQLDQKAVQDAQEAMADLGVDGLSALEQKIRIEQAAHLDEDGLAKFVPSEELEQLRGRLDEFEGVEVTALPDGVCAQMRPYQLDGFNFLCHLAKLKLGGILADDMGLGKTLQTLTWLSWLRTSRRKNAKTKPSLVVCPASVLHNWRRESERFTPDMKVLVLESGQARHNLRKKVPDHDIVVTNYSILRRDLEALSKFDFRAIILDEAQFIKNPSAQVTKSVKELKADHKLALTGTPIENRMLDLWSIVDFVQPNYLGNQDHFSQVYDLRGAEKDESAARIARRKLSAKLRPLLLRRVKKQVAKDLPDRVEQRLDCELPEEQRKLYLAELKRSREQVMKAVKQKGVAKSKMHVLAALTRLRQICCHPGLVGSDTESGKMDTLYELVEPLLEEGHKVLVFSQFVRMLQILEKQCEDRAMPTYMLTGETKNRQDVVNAFQEDESPAVFLLSLRAAGTGLNLTSASYVVIYDPWWNPAVEAQAIDRTHRIGQTATVNAYKMISPGTVEEKIWDLQQQKAKTVSDVLGDDGFAKGLTTNDLEYLFSD